MNTNQWFKTRLKLGAAVVLIALAAFAAIQFIPVDRSNPPVTTEPQWDSAQTRALAERACYDCHSNQTKWTWYSKVAPVSWLVAHDVEEGRSALNFSEWGAGQEGEEAGEEVLEGAMPPWQYLLMHPEASLNEAEKQSLVAGLNATFGSEREEGEREHEAGQESAER